MRQAVGLIVGVVVAVLFSALVEYAAHAIEGTGAVTGVPLSGRMAASVLFGWIAGTFVGALAGDAIARRVWPGYVTAILFVFAVIYTVMQNDHPLWVSLGGIVGPLAAAWLAARFLPARA